MQRPLLALAAFTLVAVSASGCASRKFDGLMRDWQGHRLGELLVTWGQPQYSFSDGRGGQVVVYTPVPAPAPATSRRAGGDGSEPSTGLQSYRNGAATSQTVYNPSMTARWPIFRLFFVDPGGRIVRSAWRGRWDVP